MRRALLAALAALTLAGPADAREWRREPDWRRDNRIWIERQRAERERAWHWRERQAERQHWLDERRAREDRMLLRRWRDDQRDHWRERYY